MLSQNQTFYIRPALTIVEMVIAMAIMATVFAVVLPQFSAIRNSWNTKAGTAEALQNGRILMDHINRNLSTAVKIISVSDDSETNGYIEFEDSDENTLRYDVNSTSNYVEFGDIGDLSDLAGPVSQFQFTCYNDEDFETPITDVNSIRLIKVEATIVNSSQSSQDKTFTTLVYLRSNWESTTSSGLVGWWRLDETSGFTAADSSSSGYDGTLTNMSGNEWTSGIVGGALEFDGSNEYIDLPIDSLIGSLTNCTIATWVNWSGLGSDWQRVFDFGTGETYNMFLTPNTSDNELRFAITQTSWHDEDRATASEVLPTGWHHLAVTIDPDNTTYTLYLDAEVVAENTSARFTPSDLGETNQNWLGRSQYAPDPYFNGVLDDFRIYDRVLDPEEVEQLFDVLRYNDFTEAKTGSDDTSITISTPDTNEADLLIAAVATDGDTVSSIEPPGGEGWTEIDISDYHNEVTLGVWWKLADASESSSHQFTWTGNEQAYGWIMHFTGHDPDDPINDFYERGYSSSTPTSPEVTTTVDNCLILRLGAFDDDDITVDDPGLSGHEAITMDTSAGSATVTMVGSWTAGLTHTAESGSNRLLIFTAFVEEGGAIGLTSVTYGGQSMTKVIDEAVGTSFQAYVVAYILDEDGIDAATSSTFAPSWSTTPDNVSYTSAFFTNVNQTTPVGETASNETSGSTPNPITTSSLSTSNGNMVIVAATCGNAGNYTVNNGFTEGRENDMASSTGVVGYKSATGADETPSVWHSVPNRQVIIGFVVQGVTAGSGTVSGGAGYVSQGIADDSGTSNFSLDSSNEAQNLTIAIAPNPNNAITGEGEISP